MRTPKVIILLVLLTWWQDFPKDEAPYQVLEFYAGVGRIAALSKFASFKAGAVDLEYGKGCRKRSRPPMDMNSNAGLLLCIHLLLCSDNVAAFFAVVCSSMVPVSRGSTLRSFLTPLGCEDFIGVRRSNKMTSRTVILMWITIIAGGTFFMENPMNSLVAHHPRYVWMVEQLLLFGLPTYKIGFWMRKYASMSWKRTWVWSSSSRIHELDLGPLTTAEKNESKTLTTRYRDSKGKVKFQGNSSLKGSQRYTYKFAAKMVSLVPKVRKDTRARVLPEPACGSLIELFNNMDWDDQCRSWDEEADLRDVIRYARGSRHLQIPLGWKDVLPKTIPP